MDQQQQQRRTTKVTNTLSPDPKPITRRSRNLISDMDSDPTTQFSQPPTNRNFQDEKPQLRQSQFKPFEKQSGNNSEEEEEESSKFDIIDNDLYTKSEKASEKTIQQNVNSQQPQQSNVKMANEHDINNQASKHNSMHMPSEFNTQNQETEESVGQEGQGDELSVPMNDIRMTNELFKKVVALEFGALFLAILGLLFSILIYEMKYTPNISQYTYDSVLYYNTVCSLGLVAVTVMRYDVLLKWNISKGLFTVHDTLLNTGQWKIMFAEMCLTLIAPYPYLNRIHYWQSNNDLPGTVVVYDTNDIFLFICFCRVYLLGRYVLILSKFLNPRSQRVNQMNGSDASTMFAIKAILKEKPYTVLFVSLGLSTIMIGYVLRVFERDLDAWSKQNFADISISIWVALITIAGVGYGDYYPKTFLGKLVGVIACFWGVFILSFFVVNLNNLLTFQANEEKAYNLLLRLHYKDELKEKATRVLASAYRQRNTKLKDPTNKSKILSNMRTFRKDVLEFQMTARQVRNFYEADTTMEIVQRMIDGVMEDVKALKAEQAKVVDSLAKLAQHVEDIIDQEEREEKYQQQLIEEELKEDFEVHF